MALGEYLYECLYERTNATTTSVHVVRQIHISLYSVYQDEIIGLSAWK